jgi:hypothetical protein
VRIDDGTMLAGSLPRTAARLVQEWRLLQGDELAVASQRARAFEPLSPIEGLRYVVAGADHYGALARSALVLTFVRPFLARNRGLI